MKPKKERISILHEDNDILVVHKPSGVLSIPDRYDEDKKNLLQLLKQTYQEVYTVHRLDAETSGVLVFAKNKTAHQAISIQFQERSVKKIYWAFVHGSPPDEEGTIHAKIDRDAQKPGKMIVRNSGKEATTRYNILQKYGPYSLLEVSPVTGRTHQIRVHCRHIGCPLMIDTLYANTSAFYLSEIKSRYRLAKFEEEKPLVDRLTLHAYSLQLNHPTSGETVLFQCDLPKDLRALKKQLDKRYSIKGLT